MDLVFRSSHKKIRQDNVKEFEKVFRKLYKPLCLYAFRFLVDMDSAEEIVQDLFYNYWKKRKSITIDTSLKSYLYQAVKHKCYKEIDHAAVKEKYSNETKHFAESNSNEDTSTIETAELAQIIDDTLNQLPDRCRQVFELSRFEGLKYHEIAKKLSISIKTVEANMGKALKLFRVNLKEYRQITC
ncbi:MAG: RNA polymerase sigma-70 factor [Bacteroidales bacterium]